MPDKLHLPIQNFAKRVANVPTGAVPTTGLAAVATTGLASTNSRLARKKARTLNSDIRAPVPHWAAACSHFQASPSPPDIWAPHARKG